MPQAPCPRAPRAASSLAAIAGAIATTLCTIAAGQIPPSAASASAPSAPAPTASASSGTALQALPPAPSAPSQPPLPVATDTGRAPGYPPAYPQPYSYRSPYQYPETIPYVEGQRPPAGYHEKTEVRRAYVAAGAAVFGVAYGGALLTALAYSDTESDTEERTDTHAMPLLIPAAGPFIGLATLDPDLNGTSWLVLDGLVQATGIAMFLVGVLDPTRKWVRDDFGLQLHVTPYRTATQTGMGLVGRF